MIALIQEIGGRIVGADVVEFSPRGELIDSIREFLTKGLETFADWLETTAS